MNLTRATAFHSLISMRILTCVLVLQSQVLVHAGSSATLAAPVRLDFPAVERELALMLRDAIVSDRPGSLELRAAITPGILKALQAVDRLDLDLESDLIVLGPLAQHLPQAFAGQLREHFAAPRADQGERLAAKFVKAYGLGARVVEEQLAPQIRSLIEAASRGAISAAELEAAVREIDRYDLYGAKLWTMTNQLRATVLGYHNAATGLSAREIAQRLLTGPLAGSQASESVPVPSQTRALGQSRTQPLKAAEPVPMQEFMDRVGAALRELPPGGQPSRSFVPAEGDSLLLQDQDSFNRPFPRIEKQVLHIGKEINSDTILATIPRAMEGAARRALATQGIVLGRRENGVFRIEPRVYPRHRAESLAVEAAGAPFQWTDDIEELKRRIKSAMMPLEAETIALAELEKMAGIKEGDSERNKLKFYLEWLLKLPWALRTSDHYDLVAARAALDEKQYGLETVKNRILQFLAVRKRKGNSKGAVVAFMGPPGVGKTAIASSVAKAMGRKFVRLSLGGVADATELRGHTRTYLGSRPGSIIRQMAQAGTKNPVMLLDEIDKVGKSAEHGSVEAALLEILDPAQNDTFRDHYLDVSFDLSEVLFICTGNELAKVYPALRDRMEIIEFPSYTPVEKQEIAQRHIIPQKQEANGVTPEEVSLTRAAVSRLIDSYTLESGVRKLAQVIDELMRVVATALETGDPAPGAIDAREIPKYLGVPSFGDRKAIENGVGVGTGLAVNGYGGTILNVEVLANPGSGQVSMRHQFKDMASDSAKNAVAFVKSAAPSLGLSYEVFSTRDLDIAFTPAIEVDGPSAGIAMASAIASALSGYPIRKGVAMTGEITLHGKVLPIGGLKEKVLAAHRSGMHTVLYPATNHKDLEDLPLEVLSEIKLIPVSTAAEVFRHVLDRSSTAKAAAA